MEKTYRLTRQQLHDLVWSRSMNALAEEFGITGNGLAKICDRLLIPHPPRGYWAGSAQRRAGTRPALPPRPDDCDTDVVISTRRAPSRRGRTRLSLTARRDQIVDAASKLIMSEGVNTATMKVIARHVGISEASIYNYFPSHTELLAFIARREQETMSQMQQSEIDKHTDYIDRVRASQAGYLDYVALKGGLLQILLGSAEVRNALKMEHQGRRAWSTVAAAANMTRMAGVPTSLAIAGSQALRAVGVRAGKLLANRTIDRATAGRLSLTIMDGARLRLIAMAKAEPEPAPPSDLPLPRSPFPEQSRGRVRGLGV